jgi:hypothetical protein
VVRTYAPVGQTPILPHPLSHAHLSVIGAVSLKGTLYFQVHAQAITSLAVTGFLRHLLRHIPGKLLIVWDGAPIHRSRVIRQFLGEGAAARIHLERFLRLRARTRSRGRPMASPQARGDAQSLLPRSSRNS